LRRWRLAVLGGTFDHLHVGHQALLATAFRVADEVAVGVTSDRFVAAHPKPTSGKIQPYPVRRAALRRWIRAHYPGRKWRALRLEDPYGGSVGSQVGVLVVSRDTERGGRAVNRERRRLGRAPVPIVSVPLVLADDLEPVSARRIRAREIGTDGRRLAPIRIALTTADPRDRKAAERAVARVFPRARLARERPAAARRDPRKRKPPREAPGPSVRTFDLTLRVSRPTSKGWIAVEETPRVRLRPRRVPGSRPADLERGLVRLLRPRQ
jgi:pantetheine-phosphate adenylyltransferase